MNPLNVTCEYHINRLVIELFKIRLKSSNSTFKGEGGNLNKILQMHPHGQRCENANFDHCNLVCILKLVSGKKVETSTKSSKRTFAGKGIKMQIWIKHTFARKGLKMQIAIIAFWLEISNCCFCFLSQRWTK